jgi:hypothetical protein
MSKLLAKQKLMDLVAGPKKTNKHVIICFDDKKTRKIKQSDRPVIVFRDFPKLNKTLEKQEIKSAR